MITNNNEKVKRQARLLALLVARGTGVINMCNDQLAVLMNVSSKTVQRDINEMADKSIIIKETTLIRSSGETRKQRDIILINEIKRRFTLSQHMQLASFDNHRIYTNEFEEVIWMRRPDGLNWERTFKDKEFDSERQAYNWLYRVKSEHFKCATKGDKYRSRSGQNDY